MPAAGKMPQRSFYMKKLLLVMLVPVLVLGLFSCGKVMDAEVMPFEIQGTWQCGTINLVLAGNEATVYDSGDTLKPATYRVEVTPTLVPKLDSAAGVAAEISVGNSNPGTIKFVGFKDKKAATLATVKFEYYDSGTPALVLYNLVREPEAVSILLPAADDVDQAIIDAITAGSYVTVTTTYTKLTS
jgi:hypothetical protein